MADCGICRKCRSFLMKSVKHRKNGFGGDTQKSYTKRIESLIVELNNTLFIEIV